jgi:hypothetical protein
LGAVGAYRQAQLAMLVDRAAEVIDQFRASELDAFDADADLFQYGRAAKELWRFCNVGDVFSTATAIADGPTIDWWARGAFKRR